MNALYFFDIRDFHCYNKTYVGENGCESMVVLQGHHLTKYFGDQVIFNDITFQLHKGERVGLVGPNGAGKTTLLRCIVGEETLDDGNVIVSQGYEMGYLAQTAKMNEDATVLEEMMLMFADLIAMQEELTRLEHQISELGVGDDHSQLDKVMHIYSEMMEKYERRGGYAFESKLRGILIGLGFKEETFSRQIKTFSGGQKTRLALAKLLMREPDILLLDEPTNYLDIKSMEWLEDFLSKYAGTILMVSHDRYFLDRVGTQILELTRHKLSSYSGNYTRYLHLKAEQAKAMQRAYEKQYDKIAKEKAFIEKYRAGVKSKQARGRETRLEKLERLEAPLEAQKVNHLEFEITGESGQRVLQVNELTKGFDDKKLFQSVNLEIRKGERVALLGDNGTGKSTLFKMIMNKLDPDGGDIGLGSRVQTAYYDQEHKSLNLDYTILEELLYHFPLSEETARNLLGAFLFCNDDVYKKIKDLSGGERARVLLCKLSLLGANFLLLDEPTNHLDIPLKEVLEKALQVYSGTLFIISHDRYFLDKIVNKIYELEDGRITEYIGNYTDYKLKKESLAKLQDKLSVKVVGSKKKRPQKKQKRPSPEKIEEEIMVLEEKLKALAEEMGDTSICEDGEKIKELTQEYQKLEAELAQLYEAWEEASLVPES